jgi:hypothetical protein
MNYKIVSPEKELFLNWNEAEPCSETGILDQSEIPVDRFN